MTSHIALITGANKGIGFETARLLGRPARRQQGMTVLIGARSTDLGEKAAATLNAEGIDARFVHLDVTDSDVIEGAAKQIEVDHGRLDVLVNNAGIAPATGMGTASATPVQAMREAYETNVFGVVAVTNAMLPLLRRSPAGRVVNVSSELGSLAVIGDPSSPFFQINSLAYPSSKTALNAVTVAYAKELADTPIKVNAANPGYCATDLNAHSGFRTPVQGATEVFLLATLDDDGPTGVFRGGEEEPGQPVPW